MARVAVVGTTSWGTTLAVLLSRNGNDVTLLARTPVEAVELEKARENKRHRPGLAFPAALRVSSGEPAVSAAELVVIAVPSATLRSNLERLSGLLGGDGSVLSATKGIEPESCLRMSEMIAEAGVERERILAI